MLHSCSAHLLTHDAVPGDCHFTKPHRRARLLQCRAGPPRTPVGLRERPELQVLSDAVQGSVTRWVQGAGGCDERGRTHQCLLCGCLVLTSKPLHDAAATCVAQGYKRLARVDVAAWFDDAPDWWGLYSLVLLGKHGQQFTNTKKRRGGARLAICEGMRAPAVFVVFWGWRNGAVTGGRNLSVDGLNFNYHLSCICTAATCGPVLLCWNLAKAAQSLPTQRCQAWLQHD
jgi:hypothetical protein